MKQNLQLFLLAGQSNMAGRGKIADLEATDTAPNPQILALDKNGDWQPANDPLHWDKAEAGVGIGKFFARRILEKNPDRNIGLIPTACGGSPISAWEPGKYFDQTDSHPYDDCLARAKRAMQDGTLTAILWHQGEGDANAQNAPLYEERLTKLIARFRSELNAPNIPFIIGQLGRFPARPWTAYHEQVDQAQQNVAAKIPNTAFVPAQNLTSNDHLHFDTASLRTLAHGYADAWFKLHSY